MSRPVLLVFVRAPVPGPVKTRLAATVGAERARRLYRELAASIWRGLEDPAWERWLCVEPPGALAEAEAWLPGADRVLGQARGDLGERLFRAFEEAFRTGAAAAAAVGSDAPEVEAGRVRRAFADLRQGAGATLVPSLDGGYALLGLRRAEDSLFRGVPWSTPGVLEATRSALRSLGWTWTEQEPVRDLDTEEDLRALERAGWIPPAGTGEAGPGARGRDGRGKGRPR